MAERLCLNWNTDGTLFCNGPSDHEGGCVLVTPETIIRSLEAELERYKAACRTIGKLQPTALAYIRDNGFVFDDIGNEPGNWKHLAFSLYTELCRADSLIRALDDED